jgi:hypothetical protein
MLVILIGVEATEIMYCHLETDRKRNFFVKSLLPIKSEKNYLYNTCRIGGFKMILLKFEVFKSV